MSSWLEIKASARNARREAEAVEGPSASLDDVLTAALAARSVTAEAVADSDPLLGGGEARLDCESDTDRVVWYPVTSTEFRRRFLLAHELAHATVHTGSFTCLTGMIDPVEGEESVPETEAYSPRERKEREANVWAREFLLPAPALRERYLAKPVRAHELAHELGLDEHLVRCQMARALLTVEPDRLPDSPGPIPILEGAQKRAAEATAGPVIVIAGPGTGKTTTLAARIGWLLDQKVRPEDITAVTFSRRAAEEMRVRVTASRPDGADGVRLDTLHAYCLDLLRRFGPWPDATVVDEARATGLVERLLPRLGLRHLLYLPDPPSRVQEALAAISRAKGNLVSPETFAAQAEADLESARHAYDGAAGAGMEPRLLNGLEAALRRAERVEEVGRVYTLYQQTLQHQHRYDFGDILIEASRLLDAHPDLLGPVEERHLLVDEFQDLNLAALRVVIRLAGAGHRLWVVGDPHQLIYRFQGASAGGILSLGQLFPNAVVVSLDQNRRSCSEIVAVFTAMVPHMHAAPDPNIQWHAVRGAGGSVTFWTAESPESELRGLAHSIRERARTTPYREQAVLARRHADLVAVAEALEEADIPVLFLAGFFERDVVRDMLALLELVSEPSGRALIRVAAFPEYDVPRADVLALLAHTRGKDGLRFPGALALASSAPGLSDVGRQGLALLQTHLAGIAFADHPWTALTYYLFDASDYLLRYPADDAQAARPHQNQRHRAALFQLLQLAGTYSLAGAPRSDRKRTFLAYVRRLAGSGQHRQLAQPPDWTAPIDAVRLLTVHGSKGLEFGAVHVPHLNRFDFYANEQDRPLVPDDLLRAGPGGGHEAEEECLHFVAASRARDHLSLSRAYLRRNWKGEIKPTKPSPFLARVRHVLPAPLDAAPSWHGGPPSPSPPDLTPLDDPPTVPAADLEAYADCPRRFAYQRRFGLATHTETTPYRRLVGIVRDLIRDVTDGQNGGEAAREADLVAEWHRRWEANADTSDPYDALYRAEGEDRVRRAFRHVDRSAKCLDTTLVLQRPRGTVTIEADLVLRDRGGRVRIQRWNAGGQSFRETARLPYAVLHEAGRATFGGPVLVQAVSAAADAVVIVERAAEGLDTIDRALEGLYREEYPARPDGYRCPSCPFYFLCPS